MSLIRGDARHLPLVDGCVDCVVTSPPYFGLRDYGHAGQIGLEPSPDAYVGSLVAVFREVRRVVKDGGTCWVNLGDSYASSSGLKTSHPQQSRNGRGVCGPRDLHPSASRANLSAYKDFGESKAKDLLGIPWRVAFALQADGWYLRSDIIWAKPNPMPESVTDRPTKSHEYLFLLSKQEKYWYDASAIAEPVSAAMLMQMEQGYDGLGLKDYEAAGVQNPSSVKARIIERARTKAQQIQATGNRQDGDRQALRSVNGQFGEGFLTRNRRSVWHIATMPYSGAHFATMPEALVEPCILAGCQLGGLVLDPFVGSGTVVSVAARLGRRGVGVDLSYQDLARKRTAQRGLPMEYTA